MWRRFRRCQHVNMKKRMLPGWKYSSLALKWGNASPIDFTEASCRSRRGTHPRKRWTPLALLSWSSTLAARTLLFRGNLSTVSLLSYDLYTSRVTFCKSLTVPLSEVCHLLPKRKKLIDILEKKAIRGIHKWITKNRSGTEEGNEMTVLER